MSKENLILEKDEGQANNSQSSQGRSYKQLSFEQGHV